MKKLIPFLFLFVPLAVWAGTITLNGAFRFDGLFTFTEPAVDMGGFVDVDTNMALVPTIAGGFGFDTNSGVNGAVVAAVESTPYGNALKITCDGSQSLQGISFTNGTSGYFDFAGGLHIRIGNRGIAGTQLLITVLDPTFNRTYTFPSNFENGDYLDIKILGADLPSEMPGELWICVIGTSTNTFTVQIGQ
jgi:hypothetical protein